jgi:prevent-host-death family protein
MQTDMQQYIPLPYPKEDGQMARRTTIPASEAHRGFGKLLKRVYGSDEHLIIERDGFPMAVLMSYQEYEQYRRHLAQQHLVELGKKVGAEAEKQGLTEEQLFKEIKETRQKLFKEHYGHLFDQA